MRSATASALALSLVAGLAGCPGDSAEPAASGPATPETEAPGAAAEGAGEAGAEASTSAEGGLGAFTEAGARFEVEAVVAVWEPDGPALRLVALPFEPTPAEVERCQKDEVFFMLMDREQRVQGFTDRTPFAEVTISWPFDAADVGDAGKSSVHVFVNNLGQSGSNQNLTFGGAKHSLELSGDLEAGGAVQVALSGEDELFDTPLTWDLDYEGPVLATRE